MCMHRSCSRHERLEIRSDSAQVYAPDAPAATRTRVPQQNRTAYALGCRQCHWLNTLDHFRVLKTLHDRSGQPGHFQVCKTVSLQTSDAG